MKSKLFVVLVLASLSVTSPRTAYSACYLCDRSDWEGANELTKLGFVMGAYAEKSTLMWGGDNRIGAYRDTNVYRDDLDTCVQDMALLARDLVDIINTTYLDLEMWELPPHIALGVGLHRVCLAHMNRARAARGDTLLERPSE